MALPPLNAVKAFDAAARHSSFVLAARELGVSPASVSQLVRKLERHLGKTLFTRFNNRILLTDAGKAIFAGVTPALNEIAETVERVRQAGMRRKLTVSAISSVAECWLAPALSRFSALHPRLRIDFSVDDTAQGIPADTDLRIHYGRLPAEEAEQFELCRDEVTPMCSPLFFAQKELPQFNLKLSRDLIHTTWGESYGTNPTWRDWYNSFAPGHRVDLSAGHQVNTSRVALQLAAGGCGIALGQAWLAREDLLSGRLVRLNDNALPLGQSYYISWQPSRAKRADVMLVKDWLVNDVRLKPTTRPRHQPATPTH